MSYYPALKQRLTCREVAPRYGLKVNAAGMTLCPFHGERSPSLKLSRGFCCFGCGAQGDVITFVSRLFEIPPGEAAQKLSADFGIPVGDHLRCPPAVQTEMETWVGQQRKCFLFPVRNAPTSDEAKSECDSQYGKELHRLTNWFVNRCIRRVNL